MSLFVDDNQFLLPAAKRALLCKKREEIAVLDDALDGALSHFGETWGKLYPNSPVEDVFPDLGEVGKVKEASSRVVTLTAVVALLVDKPSNTIKAELTFTLTMVEGYWQPVIDAIKAGIKKCDEAEVAATAPAAPAKRRSKA